MVTDHRPEAQRLGSYEIVRRLARGGMAELYLARTVGPEGFEKLVVLKQILPRLAQSPKFVRLFLDEAKLAAALDHPYIAHVYDLGKVDNSYFFTMEYVHGQDLRAIMKRSARAGRRLSIDQAVQVAHAVASALHYAHERRAPDGALLDIVHRDVSPSNVLIAYDGAIKLVDFGVAKATTSSQKTRTGTLKGKISYMSPEQAKGSPIDRRSDVFSLGIVLWELVCAQRLFKAENDLATIQMIINSEAPLPRERRPECPVELEAIIVKALAGDPRDRYQTAEELQLELEELAREHKLKLSTVALRGTMHELFAEELAAWRMAQASGVTLTEHVAAAILRDAAEAAGTPASDADHYAGHSSDDDEPELELDDDDGAEIPVEELQLAIGGAFETQRLTTSQIEPPIGSANAPPTIVIHASGPQQMPALPGQRAPSQGQMTAAAYAATEPTAFAPADAAFPLAPREWRAAGPGARPETVDDHKTKRYVIGGLVALAVIAVLALALGGSPPAPPAAVDDTAAPAPPASPDDSPVIEMKAQPAPKK